MNIEQKDPQEEIEILLRHSHHQNIVSCRDVGSFLLILIEKHDTKMNRFFSFRYF